MSNTGLCTSSDQCICKVTPALQHELCPKGKYNDLEKQTAISACRECDVGKYSNQVARTHPCTTCSAGYYNQYKGQSNCKQCEKGYYCSGGSNHVECAQGKYNDQYQQSSENTQKSVLKMDAKFASIFHAF